jgi:hypothetical protein
MSMELSDLPAAWRVLSPARELAMRLVIDRADTDDRKTCSVCGYQIRDPYRKHTNREIVLYDLKVTCSWCDAMQKHEYGQQKLGQEHERPHDLPPPVCVCGKLLKDCTVETCHPGELPRPKLRRRSSGQGSLW